MPEARQNSSKLAEMFDRASSFNALVGMAVDVVSLFMALLSSVESAPRAYRLKASNAASPFSTSIGTIPSMGTDNWSIIKHLTENRSISLLSAIADCQICHYSILGHARPGAGWLRCAAPVAIIHD